MRFFKILCPVKKVRHFTKQMLWSDGTGAEKIIDILYDAKGRKLRKTVTNNGALQYWQVYITAHTDPPVTV